MQKPNDCGPAKAHEALARRGGADRGQAAVLVVMVAAALLAAVVLAIGELGADALDRTRAQTATDAAALAGVERGRAAADRLAARHDGRIVAWTSSGDASATTVTVTVRVRDATATARATNAP